MVLLSMLVEQDRSLPAGSNPDAVAAFAIAICYSFCWAIAIWLCIASRVLLHGKS